MAPIYFVGVATTAVRGRSGRVAGDGPQDDPRHVAFDWVGAGVRLTQGGPEVNACSPTSRSTPASTPATRVMFEGTAAAYPSSLPTSKSASRSRLLYVLNAMSV